MSKKPATFAEILKFNPYHDSLGRFTGPGAAASFTYRTKDPKKQHMADMAIAREKERAKTTTAAGGDFGNGNKIDSGRKESFEERERRRKEEYARNVARFDERVKNELPDLDQDAVRRANSVSMFDHGSVSARQALSYVDEYKRKNPIQDDWTDEQKAYAKQREEEYKKLVTEYINDSNRRFADDPGWHITGRSNYNVNRHNKKMDAAQRKEQEYQEKMSRFEENTKKGLERLTPAGKQIERWRQGKWKYGETISADDPLAREKLSAKLEYLKTNHENMKAANQAARGTGSKPHPSWELSNSNQQIKATESRLKQLEQTAARSSTSTASSGTSFKGGTMKINNEINRLQLVFDGKPSAEVRSQLKANGFRWSPSQGAWQRQNTPNAERAANRIMQELNKSYPERNLSKKLTSSHTFREVLCIQSTVLKTQNTDSLEENTFTITKTDNDKRLVFGWANIAIRKNGEQIIDWQRDTVEPEDLEEAVYKYVLNFRDGGEEHVPTLRKKCRLVESVMFTEEKLKAMGIPKGTVPLGWWIGFYVDDDEAWKKIKSGHYKMFSVEGKGKRKLVDDD